MTRLKSIFAACLLCLAIGNANAETININTADPSAIAATLEKNHSKLTTKKA